MARDYPEMFAKVARGEIGLLDKKKSDADISLKLFELEEGGGLKYINSPSGEPFASMAEFLSTPQPHGLGVTDKDWDRISCLSRYITSDACEMAAVEPQKTRSEAMKGNANNNPKEKTRVGTDGISPDSGNTYGTSRKYRSAKVKRLCPETAVRVERGEITLLDAERELGIERKDRRISLPADPVKARERIIAKFGQDSLASRQEAQEPAALRTRRSDVPCPILEPLPRNLKVPPTAPLADG